MVRWLELPIWVRIASIPIIAALDFSLKDSFRHDNLNSVYFCQSESGIDLLPPLHIR